MSRIRDAQNLPLLIKLKIGLQVLLVTNVETVTAYVVYRLAAPIILLCYLCDKHIESKRPC